MKIKSFQGGFDKNLSYLIWCDSTHIACIVDASVKMTEINRFIEKHALNLEKILITHTHSDHIQFLNDILIQFPQVQLCGYERSEIEFGSNYRKLKHHEILQLQLQEKTATF